MTSMLSCIQLFLTTIFVVLQSSHEEDPLPPQNPHLCADTGHKRIQTTINNILVKIEIPSTPLSLLCRLPHTVSCKNKLLILIKSLQFGDVDQLPSIASVAMILLCNRSAYAPHVTTDHLCRGRYALELGDACTVIIELPYAFSCGCQWI